MRKFLYKLFGFFNIARKITIVESDSLPEKLPYFHILLAREDDEDWCIGMRCPCGCGQIIELMTIREAKPRWDLSVDGKGRPSLKPSIWLKKGCCSHFWIINGKVLWVR